jgi:hypothetical protein
LFGQLPSEICNLLYGASLCALHKKYGGIRPIAIGNCLRRLTSKLACFQSRNIVNSYLSPHQLGVATKLGCEAAVHTTRTKLIYNDVSPLYRLDLVDWEFAAFPIFASLLSYHGVKKLVSQLLNSKDNELIIHHYENERPTIPQLG